MKILFAVEIALVVMLLTKAADAQTLIYVAEDDDITVYDASAHPYAFVTEIPVCDGSHDCPSFNPVRLTATPDGSFVYVLGAPKTSIVDTRSNRIVDTLPIAGRSIAFTPDGSRGYIAGCGGSGVCAFNATTRTISAVIAADLAPDAAPATDIAITPDGKFAYAIGQRLTLTLRLCALAPLRQIPRASWSRPRRVEETSREGAKSAMLGVRGQDLDRIQILNFAPLRLGAFASNSESIFEPTPNGLASGLIDVRDHARV